MKIFECKCGRKFPTRNDLRIHIAILTPEWPRQPEGKFHYDINPPMARVAPKPERNPDAR